VDFIPAKDQPKEIPRPAPAPIPASAPTPAAVPVAAPTIDAGMIFFVTQLIHILHAIFV
jgi:hypothetical protein